MGVLLSVSCSGTAPKEEILSRVGPVIAAGPFRADWDSLKEFQPPEWYVDGKFGIFIHWGVYSVPAFGNEWYPRNMYREGTPEFQHHVDTFGPQSRFGYKDFIKSFSAEKFDASEWAALFHDSGARFVVPVAEHHDGFPLYDTALSEWSAAKMGPRRDVIGALAEAVRARGIVFGASSHRAEHWWFYDAGMSFDSDVRDPANLPFYGPAQSQKAAEDGTNPPDQEFLDDWLARCVELVDKYQPQLIWFDWWIEQPAFEPYLQKFAAYYYNRGHEWGKGVAINYKLKTFPPGTAVLDIERGQLAEIRPFFWQTDTSVSKNSWGYVKEQDYKTSDSIIDDLVDIVSKNGALLLNIGPRPDGAIPEPEQAILREIGEWLAVNGEAIYETRPWKIYGEGPTSVVEGSFNDTKRESFTSEDFRFTSRGNSVYAVALGWPQSGEFLVRSFSTTSELFEGEIGEVTLLGSEEAISWTRDKEGLRVKVPADPPCRNAYGLRITF
jgi:alpha-L-fucosidase